MLQRGIHALKGDREARDVILEEAMNCNNSYSVHECTRVQTELIEQYLLGGLQNIMHEAAT